MATRTSHENSNEIGVFAALTNAYCLTGETFYINFVYMFGFQSCVALNQWIYLSLNRRWELRKFLLCI
jgi:hypothetical protein